ncbi:hypothetical protein ABPG75_012654 [Micractinium tetrahymenae]
MQDLAEQFPARFDVRWHAFLLDPAFAEGGKWDGAPFADWRWRANTQGAHKLIALAGRHGKSHDAAGLLFRQTYEQGANVSDRQQLLAAAAELGLPAGEAETWLGSREAQQAVAEDDREAKGRQEQKKARGIHSVPTFVISCGGGKPVQQVGAESVKAFEVAFRKVLHEAGVSTGAGGPAAGKAPPVGAAAGQRGEAAAEE